MLDTLVTTQTTNQLNYKEDKMIASIKLLLTSLTINSITSILLPYRSLPSEEEENSVQKPMSLEQVPKFTFIASL